MVRKIVKFLWWAFFTGIFLLVIFILSVRFNIFSLFGEIPGFEVLENPPTALASEIYSEDNVVLGKLYSTSSRTNVPFDQISKKLIKTLIATEDVRFEDHSGIDLKATLRILFTLGSSGGGSTVTQQLAKNLFRMRDEKPYIGPLYETKLRMPIIKIKEWITAMRLEEAYTKQEIITMYLNTVNFGGETDGISVACHNKFNKTPSEVNWQESAVLIGLLKATTKYNPEINMENAVFRRNVVLSQVEKYGYIEESLKDSLQKLPIELNPQKDDYHSGIAQYFRAMVKKSVAEWADSTGYDYKSEGLKIYTSLNYETQKLAEAAVREHMKELQKQFYKDWRGATPWSKNYILDEIKKTTVYRSYLEKDNSPEEAVKKMQLKQPSRIFTWNGVKDTLISPIDELVHNKWMLRCGFIALDPYEVKVKAWVGGINYEFFPYDHVKQGARQPGSTFKPIVYSTAINNGYSICTQYLDGPVSVSTAGGEIWQPRGVEYTGEHITLKDALARSLNPIAARLIKDIGPENVVRHARELGISTPLDPVLSLALGSSDVKLIELAGAYTTFVNGGYRSPVTYIERIEDRYGKVLYENQKSRERIMTEENAYKVVSLLRGSTLHPRGTAKRLDTEYGLLSGNNQLGGKTGTTQNSTDGWFMGISRNIVAGCWVGGEDREVHFNSGYLGQGSRMAMPIFAKFMKKCYQSSQTEIKKVPFKIPAGMSINEITCEADTSSTLLQSNGDDQNEDWR